MTPLLFISCCAMQKPPGTTMQCSVACMHNSMCHAHPGYVSTHREGLLCSDLLALLSDDALTDEGRATQLGFLTRVCRLSVV